VHAGSASDKANAVLALTVTMPELSDILRRRRCFCRISRVIGLKRTFLFSRKFAHENRRIWLKFLPKFSQKSKWKTPNEKEGVIIHPDGKINVMIHQMIVPNEKKNIIIQLYENSELSSSQMIR
jgi:hypothetical protein